MLKAVSLLFLVFSLGCSNSKPVVSLLKIVDNFEFTNSAPSVSSLSNLNLKASCSAYFEKIEMSFDNGSTWIDAKSYDNAAVVDCSGSGFSINISNSKSPLSGQSLVSGQTIQILFRANATAGFYSTKAVTITYTPSTPIKQELLAGSTAVLQTGSGYILASRVRSLKQVQSSGGAYKILSRIKH